MIAIAGSIANATEGRRRCSTNLQRLSSYIPERLDVTSIVDADDRANSESAQIAAAIAALNSRTAFLRKLATTLESSADVMPVADALRRQASLCFVVRNMLARAFGLTQPSSTAAGQTLTVDDLLRAVAAGAAPCITSRGEISVPGWAERRQTARQQLGATALIDHAGHRTTGHVLDLSPSGLGLVGLNGASIGDDVAVTFESGTVVYGSIAWVTNRRAGVVLRAPLTPFLIDQIRSERPEMAS